MALFEGGKANCSIYADSGSAAGSEAHLKCLCTNTHSMRNKKDKLEALVFSRAVKLLALVRRGGMNPNIMTGVLGWRVIGCSGGIGSTGKVKVLHSM